MPRKPLTELTFDDRKVFGGTFKLVVRQNRADDRFVIEVYEVVDGLEMFKGHLDRATTPDFGQLAIKQITSAIKDHPVSQDSLMWLLCLNYTGLLDIYAS